MRLKPMIPALIVLTASAVPAVSQQSNVAAPARPEVLVLGTYHMANPGRDIVNMQVDDVLAPKRQAEIADVIAVLKKFRPTKIAIEAGADNEVLLKRYTDYVAGTYQLSRNETEQIGFRLAKELGHRTVYRVDVDGEFPFPRVVGYAKAHDRAKEMDGMMSEIGERVKATNAYLSSHTVLETLLRVNSDENVAWDVGHYYRLAHLGEAWDWAGADLVSDWFRRNMRIYSNIIDLVDSPNERVLVIYGYGHTGWLQHDFASDPTVRLRKLAEFAN